MNGILLKKNLMERKRELFEIIKECASRLKNAPEGSLRVNEKSNRVDYYHYDSKDVDRPAHGRYIKRKNLELARALAQKDYDEKIKEIAETELFHVNELLKKYNNVIPESLYDTFDSARKSLIAPIRLPDEDLIKEWKEKEYIAKGFEEDTPEIYTKNGERVRSKSEKIIADLLRDMGIPYKYECPLVLKPFGTIYPDFTILNINTGQEGYLEHFGLLDNPDYLDKALKKVNLYEKNGYLPGKGLIITFETSQQIFDERILKALLADYIPIKKVL